MRGIVLLLVLVSTVPVQAKSRAAREWSGPDLQYDCRYIRVAYRGLVATGVSTETMYAMAREHGITRKQIRQARHCLKEN